MNMFDMYDRKELFDVGMILKFKEMKVKALANAEQETEQAKGEYNTE